jgi:hypothetical protein
MTNLTLKIVFTLALVGSVVAFARAHQAPATLRIAMEADDLQVATVLDAAVRREPVKLVEPPTPEWEFRGSLSGMLHDAIGGKEVHPASTNKPLPQPGEPRPR